MLYFLNHQYPDLRRPLSQIAVVPVDRLQNDSPYWLSMAKRHLDKDRFLPPYCSIEIGGKNWSTREKDLG